jgi:hypothetical protein
MRKPFDSLGYLIGCNNRVAIWRMQALKSIDWAQAQENRFSSGGNSAEQVGLNTI